MVIGFEKLKNMVAETFAKAGFTTENAEQMAEVLVTAEARGVFSHGIQLIPGYMASVADGIINPNPDMKILNETDSSILADGDEGLGGIALTKAVDFLIEKARKTGSASLVMVNCNHYGAGAYYVERAARENCIAYLYANGPRMAAPFGGADRFLSTNPYSFAVPTKSYGNVVLDMATTETAGNKLVAAINDGKKVKMGTGVDRDGLPTDDPAEIMNHGALSHFGGVKGYGISFMIAAVTGLTGGKICTPDDFSPVRGNGMKAEQTFFMTITDISKFIAPDQYRENADRLIKELKRTKTAKGFEEIFFPGEIENRKYAKSLEEGVYIHDAAYENFIKAAGKMGIAFD